MSSILLADKKLSKKWRADTETNTDFTINMAWESNVSCNGERIVPKIYWYKEGWKENQGMVV